MMNKTVKQRQKRIRMKVQGTSKRPRLSVFRSNRHVFAQLIDDENGKTLLAVGENAVEIKEKQKKIDRAKILGHALAKKSLEKKIKAVIFDKGSYKYHGRVKAIAEGAREGGLIF